LKTGGTDGQVLLELVFSAAGVALVLAGAGWVLRAEWQRARCAYVVFERTHERLVGLPEQGVSVSVRVSERPGSVLGEGRCGGANERVEMAKLEGP
jgi:hypothetical protein